MCEFKLFKKQIIFIFASALLLISCDVFLIGGEKQPLQHKSILPKPVTSNGSCKAGPTKESKNRSSAAQKEEVSAPFNAEKIKGSIGTDFQKNLPHEFRLNLETCLVDSQKLDSSVPFTSFTIKYNTFANGKFVSKTISRSTDAGGCLSWTEVYPHKYVAQPFWVNLWREIIREEKGYYAGKVTIPTAVNFWLKDTETFQPEEKVRDLRPLHYRNDEMFEKYPVVEKGLECLADKASQPNLQLWAPEIGIQFNQRPPLKKERASPGDLIKKFKNLCREDQENEECFVRILNMKLTIPLELRKRNIHGSLKEERLNGGEYDITAQLIGEYPRGSKNFFRIHKKQLIKETTTMSLKDEQETKYLSEEFQIKIPYFNPNAEYKLFLEIKTSKPTNLPFRKFQGIYPIGEINPGPVEKFTMDSSLDAIYRRFDDSDTDESVTIIEDANIKYAYSYTKEQIKKDPSLITKILTVIAQMIFPNEEKKMEERENKIHEYTIRELKNNQSYPTHMTVSIDTVRFANTRNDRTCETNETVVTRKVEYVGRACLKDHFAGKLEKTNFRIFRENMKFEKEKLVPESENEDERYEELFRAKDWMGIENLSTNQFHCITWKDTIEHKNFDRQIYFPRRMHFISEDLNLYGEALIAVSPWHNQFQFFQDITQLHADSIRTEDTGVEHPRLVIPQFKSVNLFPSAVIDKLLSLTMKYHVRFLFQPIITRPDSLAWGKLPRSRELIRDGYYLLRVLVVRNPQETGSLFRAKTKSESDKNKQIKINKRRQLSFKDLKYLSHTDTIIKVEANFVNAYIPIEFTTEQLLYLASRNLVIIQIVPANPEKYVHFKPEEDSACHVNEKTTIWEPYRDHDLITLPYVGPMNVQNWTNWNIFQEGCNRDSEGQITDCLRTDDIIAQSTEGIKHREFLLDSIVDKSICDDQPENKKSSHCKEIDLKKDISIGKAQKITVLKGVGGSNSCIDKLNLMRQKETGRSGYSESDFVIQTPRNKEKCPEDNKDCKLKAPELGSNECKDNPSCENVLSYINNSELFGEIECIQVSEMEITSDTSENIERTWRCSDDNNNSIQFKGLGTEECIDEDKIITISPTGKEVPVLSMASPLEEIEKPNLDTLLQNFASANALKILDLSNEKTREVFLNDINKQLPETDNYAKQTIDDSHDNTRKNLFHIKYTPLKNQYNFIRQAFPNSTENDEEFESLWKKMVKTCREKYISHITDLEVGPSSLDWRRFLENCSDSEMKVYLDDLRDDLREKYAFLKDIQIDSPLENRELLARQEKLEEPFTRLAREEDLPKKLIQLTPHEMNWPILYDIVNNGVDRGDKILQGSFTHSLCGFWFDSYIKDYLEEEQMLTAFNNFIRTLNYKMILDSDTLQDERDLRDFDKWLGELLTMIPGENGLEKCAESYYKCVMRDYCPVNHHSNFTQSTCQNNRRAAVNDKSCGEFILTQCEKENTPLCGKKASLIADEEQCKRSVKLHCEMNPQNSFCLQYENKCLSNYLACSDSTNWDNFNKARIEFSNHFQQKKDGLFDWFSGSHPLKTCLKNPYEFFSFSRKMIVEDISDVRFGSGLMQHFSLNGSFSVGSYLNWAAERSTGMGLKLGLSPLKFLQPKTNANVLQTRRGKYRFKSLDIFDASGDIGIGIGSNEGNSSRRALDKRLANSLFMVISESTFEIDVTKFRKCLVIKPRVNAFTVKYGEKGKPQPYDEEGEDEEWDEDNIWPQSFFKRSFKKIALSRPGLIICNPPVEKDSNDPETIEERYYYVSQSNIRTDTAHILNLYDIDNRPFVAILRGQGEFLKYFHLLRQNTEAQNKKTGQIASMNEPPENLFLHYPHPVEDLAGYSLAMRTFGDTGFQPGIYTYPTSEERLDVLLYGNQESPFFDFIRNGPQNWVFDMPRIPKSHIPVLPDLE